MACLMASSPVVAVSVDPRKPTMERRALPVMRNLSLYRASESISFKVPAANAGLRVPRSSLGKVKNQKEREVRSKWTDSFAIFLATELLSNSTALASDMAPSISSGTELVQKMNPAYGEVASFLESTVQFLYLGSLLILLGGGSFLVVRQVLVKRELENAAKDLQERVRSGEASSEEYYELGAIMLRKKFYLMANRYLEQAITKWEGDELDLAQVHNALGFSYFSEEKLDKAVKQYEKALKLQPGYVTAWNNLGNVLEKKQDWAGALKAYQEALTYDPNNGVALGRSDNLKFRVQRLPSDSKPRSES